MGSDPFDRLDGPLRPGSDGLTPNDPPEIPPVDGTSTEDLVGQAKTGGGA